MFLHLPPDCESDDVGRVIDKYMTTRNSTLKHCLVLQKVL